jgi:hypothetical protein
MFLEHCAVILIPAQTLLGWVRDDTYAPPPAPRDATPAMAHELGGNVPRALPVAGFPAGSAPVPPPSEPTEVGCPQYGQVPLP